MISRSQKIRLGLFILVSCSIILIAIASISYNRLFSDKDVYYITYSNQSLIGVDIGSQVKYLGITVGSVRGLQINPDNVNEIIVTIEIDPETPITNDVKADLITMGITGIKTIELSSTSSDAERLKPGSFIQAGKSVTAEFIERAESIALKTELVLDNMLELTEIDTRERILTFIDEAQGAILKVNRMLDDNQERMERAVSNIDTVSMELNRMVVSLNSLVSETNTLISRNQWKVNETIDDLSKAVRYLNTTARMVNSDPSILLRGSRPNNPPDDRVRKN